VLEFINLSKNSGNSSGLILGFFPLFSGSNAVAILTQGFSGIRNKEAGIKNIIRYVLLVVFRLTSVKSWNRKLNAYSTIDSNSEFIDYLMESKKYSTKIDSKALDEVVECKFEDRMYNIPKEYDHILTAIYGDDYMEIPPVEKRIQHDDFVAYIKKEK